MNNNDKQPKSYSKIMAGVMLFIFILTLAASFIFMAIITLRGTGEIVDYVVCTTAITVVAGLLGMTMKSYYSKAGLENVAYIRKGVYREIMDVRLEYDRKVLEMRNEFGVSEDEITEIEMNAPFKDLSDAVVSQTTSKLDSVDSASEEEPDINSF